MRVQWLLEEDYEGPMDAGRDYEGPMDAGRRL